MSPCYYNGEKYFSRLARRCTNSPRNFFLLFYQRFSPVFLYTHTRVYIIWGRQFFVVVTVPGNLEYNTVPWVARCSAVHGSIVIFWPPFSVLCVRSPLTPLHFCCPFPNCQVWNWKSWRRKNCWYALFFFSFHFLIDQTDWLRTWWLSLCI